MRRILRAGAECLARLGNEKTSVQDVADAAGLGRATVYRHFDSRATLLSAVTAHEHDELRREVERRTATTSTLEEALAIIVETRAAASLRYRTREHLSRRDRGLAYYLTFERASDVEATRALVREQVDRAHGRGELAEHADPVGATEWIVLALSTLPTLLPAAAFDVDDPASIGRFFAAHLCRGVVRPTADRGTLPKRGGKRPGTTQISKGRR